MNVLSMKIQSRVGMIESVVEAFTSIAQSLAVSEENRWDIEISLREALANAILHGNHKDESKSVTVRFLWDEKQFILSIKDQGEGTSSTPPPLLTAEETPEDFFPPLHGRGKLIIASKMDKVIYQREKSGLRLLMRKSLRPL